MMVATTTPAAIATSTEYCDLSSQSASVAIPIVTPSPPPPPPAARPGHHLRRRREGKRQKQRRRRRRILILIILASLLALLLSCLWVVTLVVQLHTGGDHNINSNSNINSNTHTTNDAAAVSQNVNNMNNNKNKDAEALQQAASARVRQQSSLRNNQNNNNHNNRKVAEAEEWSNPKHPDLVHVIQTRFMQMQPHLLHLGQARLQLLEALTAPSLTHQTVPHFLWIVRTDPDLDASLREPLIELIQRVSRTIHVVLVASNDNPEGFREKHCIKDMNETTLLAGSGLELVHSYHRAAAAHVLLETRLDADDAVAVDFVELVQTNAAAAAEELGNNNENNNNDKTNDNNKWWRVWCAENHVEWQYDSPWTTTADTTTTAAASTGALLGLRAGHCITPGLTWQYSVGVHRSSIPVSKHHQIQKVVPPCQLNDDDDGNENNNKNGNNDDATFVDNSNKEKNSAATTTNCLVKLGGDLPLALRARTPTSAGMDHILIANSTAAQAAFPLEHLQNSKWKDSQAALWQSLPVLFGVEAAALWRVRAHMARHLPEIACDALRGQCTKGHSCKKKSQAVLEELVRQGCDVAGDNAADRNNSNNAAQHDDSAAVNSIQEEA